MPTNYERHFGSPAATANTLVAACAKARSCFSCPAYDAEGDDCPISQDYDCTMNWLESEDDDAD